MYRQNDLPRCSSALGRQYGSCSSIQRGDQQLISPALEANTDIDIHRLGHQVLTAPKQAELNFKVNVKHPNESRLVVTEYMLGTVNSPRCTIIWTEAPDHALSLIGCVGGRAGSRGSSTLVQTRTLSHVSSPSPEHRLWIDAFCLLECDQYSLLCPKEHRPLPERAEVVQRRGDLQLLHYADERWPGCVAAWSKRGHLCSGYQQHLC